MSEHTAEKDAPDERDDYEALAEIVRGLGDYIAQMIGIDPSGPLDIAAAILSSDWLADRIADAKAEALREAADAVPWTGAVTPKWLRDRADPRPTPPAASAACGVTFQHDSHGYLDDDGRTRVCDGGSDA